MTLLLHFIAYEEFAKTLQYWFAPFSWYIQGCLLRTKPATCVFIDGWLASCPMYEYYAYVTSSRKPSPLACENKLPD